MNYHFSFFSIKFLGNNVEENRESQSATYRIWNAVKLLNPEIITANTMTERSFTVFYNTSNSWSQKRIKSGLGEQLVIKKSLKNLSLFHLSQITIQSQKQLFSDLEHLSRQRRFILYKCAKTVQEQKPRQIFFPDVLVYQALEMIENDILLYLCLWNYVLTQIKYEDKLIITPTRLLREKKIQNREQRKMRTRRACFSTGSDSVFIGKTLTKVGSPLNLSPFSVHFSLDFYIKIMFWVRCF